MRASYLDLLSFDFTLYPWLAFSLLFVRHLPEMTDRLGPSRYTSATTLDLVIDTRCAICLCIKYCDLRP